MLLHQLTEERWMALTKVAQAEYDRLRSQYNYGHDQATEEAEVYAKLVTAAKRKPRKPKADDA